MICAARLTPAGESWVGLALLGALSLPAARHALESSMTGHMLVQFPLLALSGMLLAGAHHGAGARMPGTPTASPACSLPPW